MKICFYIDSLGSGGAQRQIVSLATEMKRRGHTVIFFTYHPDDFFLSKLIDNNIVPICISAKNSIDLILKTRKQFKVFDPDVVVSFLTSPGFICCAASIFPHRWKLVTGERNSKNFIFDGFRGKLIIWSEKFSDLKVANSDVGRLMWVKKCPKYSGKIKTIYNPVIVNSLECRRIERGDYRRIVIAASYQYTKNPVKVAEAVANLNKDERERVVIDWYGRVEANKGDFRAYDEAAGIISSHGLEKTLRLHPETKEIYEEMINADAVALFSTVEGLPNAICEGMMLGKIILMTPVSDYRIFVTPDNGILCKDAEASSITCALREFINLSDDDIGRMGDKSRELANELFDFDTNMNKWETMLLDITK